MASPRAGSSILAGAVYAAVLVPAVFGLAQLQRSSAGERGASSAEILDLRAHASHRVKVPAPLAYSGMARVGRQILFVGGVSGDGHDAASSRPLSTTWLFDPDHLSWRAGPSLHVPRAVPKVASLKDGRVLVVQGERDLAETYLSPVTPVDARAPAELSTPALDGWVELPALAGARDAIALDDGRVLLDLPTKMALWTPGQAALVQVPRPLADLEPNRTPDLYGDKLTPFTRLADGRVALVARHAGQDLVRAFSPGAGAWQTIVAADSGRGRPFGVLPTGGLVWLSEPNGIVMPSSTIPLPDLDGFSKESTAVLAGDRWVLIGGDARSGAAASDVVSVVDLRSRRARATFHMHHARRRPHALLLDDHRILVQGGESRGLSGSQVAGFAVAWLAWLGWLALPLMARRRLRRLPFFAGAAGGATLVMAALVVIGYSQALASLAS